MPCGGIYPIKGTWVEQYATADPDGECFYCNKAGNLTHFCDEWDCYLHAECIDGFLQTPEGEVVIAHEHEVIKEWDL